MVGSDKRLALRAVDDQCHRLAKVSGIELEPCRETRASQADKSALLDCAYKAGLVCDHRRLDGRVNFLLAVGLDHYERVISAHCVSLRLNAGNDARYACMNRHVKKSVCVSDLLSDKNRISLFDQRLTRCTDVLRHRDLYHIRDGHYLSRTSGRILVVAGMNAVQMLCTKHLLLPLFWLILKNSQSYYNAMKFQTKELLEK